MRTKIVKRDNEAVIRIPARVMRAARLDIGQEVELRVEDGRVLIEATFPPTYDLDELVAGITDDNRHEVLSFGEPVGKEVW